MILHPTITVPNNSWAGIFYNGADQRYSKKNQFIYRTGPGENQTGIYTIAEPDIGKLRLVPGEFFRAYELRDAALNRLLWPVSN